MIHKGLFKLCSQLLHLRFCDEIEAFVSRESMRDWWTNNGVHESSLKTYSFLVEYNIPRRVGLLRHMNRHLEGMLRSIPSISLDSLNSFFDCFNSKLIVYKIQEYAPILSELTIWEIVPNVLSFLAPNVLSFLTDDNNNEDDNDGDGSGSKESNHGNGGDNGN